MNRISINDLTSQQLDELYTRAEQAEAALDGVRQARRRINSALIAVEPHLAKPYPDDPRWTPWTRFVAPALNGLTTALETSSTAAPPTPPATFEQTARVFAGLHRSAEQDVTRVIDLYERWVKAGPPPLGTLMSRWWDARLAELHDAIRPPTHDQESSA